MLDITVKTIDGLNRSYSIPDNYTVIQFKEKISASLNIPVERQRLIFQGRELKDEKFLRDFDVNGKTVHLVQRTPPSLLYQRPTVNSTPNDNNSNVPRSTNEDQNNLNNVFNQILGGLNENQNATNNSRNVDFELHINLGNVTQTINEQDLRNRIKSIKKLLKMAHNRLKRLEEIQSGAPLDDTQTDNSQSNNTEASASAANNVTEAEAEPTNISVSVLGELINSIMETYAKFQPYLLEYQNFLMNNNETVVENSENRRQRFCNNINDMMHLMGHIFHNLSDLHINLWDRPPRNIHTMIPFQTAIISAVPIEANVQIPTPTPQTNNNNNNNNNNNENSQTNLINQHHRIHHNIATRIANDLHHNEHTRRIIPIAQSINNFPMIPNLITLNQISAQIIPREIHTTTVSTTTNSSNNNNSNINQENLNERTRDPNVIGASFHIRESTGPNAPPQTENHNASNVNINTGSPNIGNLRSSFMSNPLFSNTQRRTVQQNNSSINGDPYLQCNSVHFINSSINQLVRNSTILTQNQSLETQNSNNNNNSQRRRHPAGNHNLNNETDHNRSDTNVEPMNQCSSIQSNSNNEVLNQSKENEQLINNSQIRSIDSLTEQITTNMNNLNNSSEIISRNEDDLEIENHHNKSSIQDKKNEKFNINSELPIEWMPIIKKDFFTDAECLHKYSFSDAYLSEMSTKRRKLNKKNLKFDNVIKYVMKKVIPETKMKENYTSEYIQEQLFSEKNILNMVKDRFDDILKERLKTDKDYNEINSNEKLNFNDNERIKSIKKQYSFTKNRMK